ncbi:MAG: high-affinity zinc uptake system binding-protein ZnuA [Armatimonadota bacterium]|nr:MAG: high-affinity zinc uptake system binding-protein ZnuA [Armatimonadota bacterium]
MGKVEKLQKIHEYLRSKQSILLGIWLLALVSCTSHDANRSVTSEKKPLHVVATFFPVADIVQQVGAPHVSVQTLLPPEGELHAFAPTARQMKLLQQAEVVFALGLEAEPFLDTMLRGLGRKRPRVVELAEGCWTLPAAAEHEHHAHLTGEREEHEHQEAVDPHVWLSLSNAMRMAQNAVEALVALDPAHAEHYQRNASRLITEMQLLQQRLRDRAKGWRHKKFIAAHGAYRYLAKEAGIEQVAVFEPLPGVEPSARWLRDLMRTARREGVKVIFAAPPASSRLVEAVAADLGVPVFLLDPLERTWKPSGESYQQRMMRNIETLDKAMR